MLHDVHWRRLRSSLRPGQILCPGSAQRTDTGSLQAFGTSLQVVHPSILDHFLKTEDLLNCYIEITLLIELICDRKR